jgi:hypothetical protein
MRVKHYAFAAASVALLVLVLASPSLAAQGNAKPCLCHPTISPMKGTARTVYVATVKYSDPDGDAPAKVEVYVDNVAYPMRLVGGRAANGTYRARLTLPPGEHSYYFYAEDARGESERFPRYGARTGPFVGATKPMNLLPILSEGGVYFGYGSDQSIYTYTVQYRDRDKCKPPRCVKVFIDGLPHEMALHSGTATNGTYLYRTMLPVGPHAYYFMALDDNGDCASLPAKGFIRGPEVLAQPNSAPALIDHRIEPAAGGTTNRYGYLVHYNDVDGDNPPTALIYIDNVPHAMRLVKGSDANGLYSYVSRLFLSNMHTYYFYFEDGKGGTCRLPAVGVYHGPVVTR